MGGGRGSRDGDGAGSTLQRWFWFGALWLGGVAAVTLVAWAIRVMVLP